MCCADDRPLDVPAPVIEMVARYRELQRREGHGWGEEALPDFFTWARFSLLGPTFERFAATGDWAGAVRAVLAESDLPPGLVVVELSTGGHRVTSGPVRSGIAGRPVPVDVVVLAPPDRDGSAVVAGSDLLVGAGGAALRTLDVAPADGTVTVHSPDGGREDVRCVRALPAGRLRLRAPCAARWSVLDAEGCAWFPDDVPVKHDADHRPFFHGAAVDLAVPAGSYEVVAARGIEFERTRFDVEVVVDSPSSVTWEPLRRFDPGADGWRSGDLHVHLNYSGDHVLELADAHRMQVGEGLDLVVLQAGNMSGSLVYDHELLEATAGEALWEHGHHDHGHGEHGHGGHGHTATAGLEFRNGLLGHLHGLGLQGTVDPPYTGDEGTPHPFDWPPNAVAAEQMRDLGAVVTYAHPAFTAISEPEDLYAPARTVEARELVADAALGLVDSVEMVSCFDDTGAAVLYHHLLNCGLRLGAVAGSDAFLSFAHGPGVASNPPGWCRTYAHLGDGPVTVDAYRDAVRAGRTVATNGPWVQLSVGGARPGAVLEARPGQRLAVVAAATGGGIERLVVHGPDGVLATAETGPADTASTAHLDLDLDLDLEVDLEIGESMWLCAAA